MTFFSYSAESYINHCFLLAIESLCTVIRDEFPITNMQSGILLQKNITTVFLEPVVVKGLLAELRLSV